MRTGEAPPTGAAPALGTDGDLATVLAALGATADTLPHGVRKQLDVQGFAVLPDVLDDATTAAITQELTRIAAREGRAAGSPRPTARMLDAADRGGPPHRRLSRAAYRATFRAVLAVTSRLLAGWPDLRRTLAPLHPPIGRPHGALGRELLAMAEVAARQEGRGVGRLTNLLEKGEVFDRCLDEPRVLTAVAYLLGSRFKLSSLNARLPERGAGLQPLHVDWLHGIGPREHYACNTLWFLDDADPDNGGTRVVPGSHRWASSPVESLEDTSAPHPEEVVLSVPRGAVLVLNSHTWHGGTTNRSGRPRRILQAYFCHRASEPQTLQRAYLSAATRARLGPLRAAIADVG